MTAEELLNEAIDYANSPEGQRRADELIEQYKNSPEGKLSLDLKEHDILKVLKMSYIAQRFFGRSRSWITHKLNHDIVNGKPDEFTADERERLKHALETISEELQEIADNL